MNDMSITQIGENGDNNAFFPSAGGGKICTGNADTKLQFVFNMWTGKRPSSIYYAEMDI